MKRRRDWERRLLDFVRVSAERPHRYGSHDCLLFPAGAVKAVTGKDFGRGHRRKYRSAATASRYLRSLGFDSAEALIDSLLLQKPVAKAQRGDIVLGDDGIPGVCMGGEALFVGAEIQEQGEKVGLVRTRRNQWTKAWRVG